jgi:arginase
MLKGMKLQLVGAAMGLGAQDTRTANAPQSLLQKGLIQILSDSGFNIADFKILETPATQARLMKALPMIAQFNRRLAALVKEISARDEFPIIFGGDHSIAAGSWSGIVAANPTQELGLLWVDAHLDSHTSESSESGAVHGMPLAALLGHGDSRLTQIETPQAKIKPENVCVLGARSYEAGEEDLLKRLGVRIFTMTEIRQRGFEACFREAFTIVTKRTQKFGLTLDLDAFDPAEIPATGSLVEGGLTMSEFRSSLRLCGRDPRLAAFELVEYNPALDTDQSTFLKIVMLLEELLWSRALGQNYPYLSVPFKTSARHLILQ